MEGFTDQINIADKVIISKDEKGHGKIVLKSAQNNDCVLRGDVGNENWVVIDTKLWTNGITNFNNKVQSGQNNLVEIKLIEMDLPNRNFGSRWEKLIQVMIIIGFWV